MKPELLPYANMPPCTAKEVIAQANKVLRALRLPDVQIRTLRFYIAQGVVPPPIGSPKFARYGFTHLENLVLSRVMQDQGMTLADIRGALQSPSVVRERKSSYGRSMTTIDLTPHCRLEFDNDQGVEANLMDAQEAIQRMLGR